MTIQQRILTGQVAVPALLIVLALYGAMLLKQARQSREQGVQSRNDVRDVQTLQLEFEEILNLERLWIDLEDHDYKRSATERLRLARPVYDRLLNRLSFPVDSQGVSHRILDRIFHDHARALFEFLFATPFSGPSAAEVELWSEGHAREARSELDLLEEHLASRWERESDAIERNASRAELFGMVILLTTAATAFASSLIAIRTLRKPVEALMTATEEVAGGNFDVSLPAAGDDEISRLSRAFTQMSSELAKARKLEADFLAIASHELKTPLTCIKGSTEMMRRTLPPTAEGARYLDEIDREIDNLAGKASQLLMLGVIEAGQLQLDPYEFKTKGFLLTAVDGFRPVASRQSIDFRISLDPDLPSTLTADPNRLRQVFRNLLDNAFKYTPPGGRIRFDARSVEGFLEVEVSDTGPGIPAELLPVIFEKYSRAGPDAPGRRPGTGLGLAVARGIVLAHGGKIEARSTPGQGSVFVVCLPTAINSANDKEVA